MSQRTADFAEELKHDLYAGSSVKLLELVSDDLALVGQFQGYCDDLREGLQAVEEKSLTVPELEVKLSARKSSVLLVLGRAATLKAVDSHHYTLERLLSNLTGRAQEFARDLASK